MILRICSARYLHVAVLSAGFHLGKGFDFSGVMRGLEKIRCVRLARKIVAAGAATLIVLGSSQSLVPPSWGQDLDPTRNLQVHEFATKDHVSLPEKFIWTSLEDSRANNDSSENRVRYFKQEFAVGDIPREAMLYIAGPKRVRVYLNGSLVEHTETPPTSGLSMRVFAISVTRFSNMAPMLSRSLLLPFHFIWQVRSWQSK